MDSLLVRSKYGVGLLIGDTIIATEEVAVNKSDVSTTISQWVMNGWHFNGGVTTNIPTGAQTLYFTALITHTQTAQDALNKQSPLYFMGREVVSQGFGCGVFLI